MGLQSLSGVLRTTRGEAARRGSPLPGRLIEGNALQQEALETRGHLKTQPDRRPMCARCPIGDRARPGLPFGGPRTWCDGLPRSNRTNTSPVRGPVCEGSHEVDDERDSSPRLDQPFGRWRKPRRRIRERGRRSSHTTPVRIEHVFPRVEGERRNRVRGGVGSSRQPLAALQPPSLENRATRTGGHPRPKTVLGGSALLVGLIGAFHSGLLHVRIRPGWARKSGSQLDCRNSPRAAI